ncbi:hypothetical protein D3C71_1877490 [compost metagenome]
MRAFCNISGPKYVILYSFRWITFHEGNMLMSSCMEDNLWLKGLKNFLHALHILDVSDDWLYFQSWKKSAHFFLNGIDTVLAMPK